ncbi:hypothetical protein BpHYR1_026833 [Brachionus plicatilis]|uniref:Secreted protein n=1 Tax=Brachionus plicatilis TaxID=10195 RepID=A0A3M7QC11_BRAPC|nr:hypothetical protein BpHYR1_026833 [Brachionus plicatilis]
MRYICKNAFPRVLLLLFSFLPTCEFCPYMEYLAFYLSLCWSTKEKLLCVIISNKVSRCNRENCGVLQKMGLQNK